MTDSNLLTVGDVAQLDGVKAVAPELAPILDHLHPAFLHAILRGVATYQAMHPGSGLAEAARTVAGGLLPVIGFTMPDEPEDTDWAV